MLLCHSEHSRPSSYWLVESGSAIGCLAGDFGGGLFGGRFGSDDGSAVAPGGEAAAAVGHLDL